MSKTILAVLFGVVIGSSAFAQDFDLNDLSCDTQAAPESAAPAFDLKSGWYVPGDTSQFCAVYKLQSTSHYPCNGNIKTLTLTCENKQWAFSCQAGNCVTSDGARQVVIASGCTDRASYRSSDKRTVLYYDGPCL